MKPVVSKSTISKAGNSPEENEDFLYILSENSSQIDKMYCYAVTDGATESSFAKEWAELLAKSYCEGNLCDKAKFTDSFFKIQENWLQKIESKESTLPWYALEKAKSGAFSSLIGLKIYEQGTWEAMAVGDSCVFQVRQEQLITKFPIECSKEFNNCPFLISSLNSKNSQLVQNTKFIENKWEIGDSFYLMTDALSCWFLKEYEQGNYPWLTLKDLNDKKDSNRLRDELQGNEAHTYKSEFQEKIDSLRARKEMRNDDVTLVSIILEN